MAKIERLARARVEEPEASTPSPRASRRPPRGLPPFRRRRPALGGKGGFAATRPDQATDAAVALLLARDEDGSRVARADVWLAEIKEGKGAGVDALRLATARQMAKAAPKVGRALEDDAAAREVLAAVASSVPGACPTYARLGAGADAATLPVELSPDHAACVQKDLARREGLLRWHGSSAPSKAPWPFRARPSVRSGRAPSSPAPEPHVALGRARTVGPRPRRAHEARPRSEAAALEIMAEIHAEAGVASGPTRSSRMFPPRPTFP